jgi:hypothetical protein
MADIAPATPRRKRRWLRALIVVLAIIMVLIAALPTLVSWGLGQGLIRSAINKSINGTVAIDTLSVGWFSPLKMHGFTITDRSGAEAVKLNVDVTPGLFKLATSRSGPIEVNVSGSIRGEVREDNSISLGDLVITDQKKTPPRTKPAGAKSEPVTIPAIAVNVDGLSANLTYAATRQVVTLDDLRGSLACKGQAEPITVDLHGKTSIASPGSAAANGNIDITGDADGLINALGQMSLKDAAAKLDVKATSIPLPLALPTVTGPTDLQTLTLSVRSDDLTGKINIEMTARAIVPGHEPSDINSQIALDRVLSSQGEFSPAGGSAHISVQLDSLPILFEDLHGTVQSLKFIVASDDLTKMIDMTVDGSAALEGEQPSELRGKVAVERLFDSSGAVDFALDRVTGRITGQSVPTPPLQPFLAATPIVALRDIGPTVDVEAEFSSGAQHDVSIVAFGPKARLELIAKVGEADGPITGSRLLIASPAADPALVKGLTDLVVDRPTDVELLLTSFSLPAVDLEKDSRPKPQYAATGSLKVKGPTGLVFALPDREPMESPGGSVADSAKPQASVEVRDVVINIDSPELAQHLKIDGSANIDGGTVAINETITNLFHATGELAPMAANPVGTITVQKLPGSTLAKFAPGPRGQERIVEHVIGGGLNASLDTAMDGSNLRALIQANAAGLESKLTAIRQPQSLRISEGRVIMTVSPALAQAIQGDEANAIALQSPATAVVQLQPFDLPASAAGQYDLPAEPIRARISLEDAVVSNVPSVAEPIGIKGFGADIIAKLAEPFTVAVNGEATVRRSTSTRPVSVVSFDAAVEMKGESFEPTSATFVLDDLSVRELEQMLGKQPGALSQWTGDQGSLTATLNTQDDRQRVTLQPQLPNFAGEFVASLDEHMLDVTGQTSAFTLSRTALEARLNPAPGEEDASEDADTAAAPADAPNPRRGKRRNAASPPTQAPSSEQGASSSIAVQADVPMSLAISTLRVPVDMVKGQPFDPAQADIALALQGGPMKLVMADGSRTTVHDLDMKLNSRDLSKGLNFALIGKASAAEAGAEKQTQAGKIDVKGAVLDLVNAEKQLDTTSPRLRMTADVSDVPTALADVLVNMQGLLVAALGPQMKARFDAENFSTNSGRLDAHIDTTNGFLQALVQGREETLRTRKDEPIKAELEITPPLRQRLLQKLHPILADIRTTEQPLRATMGNLVAPTDGDMTKLKADIEITIGKVELDSGSTTLKLLTFFDQKGRETIPGEIEPIIAKIRDGILTYDTFAVRIDKYTLVYSGKVDLVNRTVDLRTQIPLEALGHTFKELQGYADKIVVPLVTRGPIDNPRTQIDPDFDVAKEALKAGFKGGLGDLLKNIGGKKQ